MKKTTCMGECPDYDISIFENGKVILNARQFLEYEGSFEAQLSKDRTMELITLFEESAFNSFKDRYTSNFMDLPTTTISFNYGDVDKSIVDYDGAPQELKQLEAAVARLIDELNWKPIK